MVGQTISTGAVDQVGPEVELSTCQLQQWPFVFRFSRGRLLKRTGTTHGVGASRIWGDRWGSLSDFEQKTGTCHIWVSERTGLKAGHAAEADAVGDLPVGSRRFRRRLTPTTVPLACFFQSGGPRGTCVFA